MWDISPVMPRFMLVQYTEGAAAHEILAVVPSIKLCYRMIQKQIKKIDGDKNYWIVIDGHKSAKTDCVHTAGACCHSDYEIFNGPDGFGLMPVEVASIMDGDSDLVFLTTNRTRRDSHEDGTED